MIVAYVSLLTWGPIDEAIQRLQHQRPFTPPGDFGVLRAELLVGLASLLLLTPLVGMVSLFLLLSSCSCSSW